MQFTISRLPTFIKRGKMFLLDVLIARRNQGSVSHFEIFSLDTKLLILEVKRVEPKRNIFLSLRVII